MSRNRQRGTEFETATVNYLHEQGFPEAVRTGSAAYGDGDVLGIPGVVIENKNQKKMELAAWVDQAAKAAERRGKNEIPVVVHKRKGKGISQAYATLSLEAFVQLVKAAQ